MQVRVRYAPSPTGSPHVGGVRTALFNYLFARRHGGAFVLRIEDTDTGRNRPETVAEFLDAFRWVGMDWDEGPDVGGPWGPYVQSERTAFHREAAERLERSGQAYRCYCTVEELEADRERARHEHRPPRYSGRCRNLSQRERERLRQEGRASTLRLKVPEDGVTVVHDLIRGDVTFEHQTLGDFVIVKSDAMATYNFAAAVDDNGMGITHVIRGEEHLSNTPRQILVYQALGLPLPLFAHVPMILAPDRAKLSKRHGATSVAEFREQGYLGEALCNYLLLLGLSPQGDEELFSLAQAVEHFDLDRIQKNAAVYDVKKLTWLNGIYLRRMDVDELEAAARPFFERAGIPLEAVDPAWLRQVLVAVRERVSTLAEMVEAARYFFEEPTAYDPAGVDKHFSAPQTPQLLREVAEALASLETFDAAGVDAALTRLAQERDVPRAKLIHPVRLAVSGRTMGPGLFDLVALVGRERSVRRLRAAADRIEAAS